jgi:hypothetical protein
MASEICAVAAGTQAGGLRRTIESVFMLQHLTIKMPISKGQIFKLHESTLGIHTDPAGSRMPITIPPDALVTIMTAHVNGNPLIEITWETKSMMIFAIDLQNRGERVYGSELGGMDRKVQPISTRASGR